MEMAPLLISHLLSFLNALLHPLCLLDLEWEWAWAWVPALQQLELERVPWLPRLAHLKKSRILLALNLSSRLQHLALPMALQPTLLQPST